MKSARLDPCRRPMTARVAAAKCSICAAVPFTPESGLAATAEELMRSRYSAYAVGDMDYVWRTWHPRTRPEALTPSGETWTGLEILDTVAGQPGDEAGEVEFRAAQPPKPTKWDAA